MRAHGEYEVHVKDPVVYGIPLTSFNPEGVETTNGGYLGPTTYGVQVGASPIVRSFTFGVNLNF